MGGIDGCILLGNELLIVQCMHKNSTKGAGALGRIYAATAVYTIKTKFQIRANGFLLVFLVSTLSFQRVRRNGWVRQTHKPTTVYRGSTPQHNDRPTTYSMPWLRPWHNN